MLTTRYVDGAPNWLDVGTPDLEGARAFYGGLFGWSLAAADAGAGGYGLFERDGRVVAGLMAVDPGQARPAWCVYFRSPDADAAARAAEGAGGSVRTPPADVGDKGRTAILADPARTVFGVWQPGAVGGLEAAGEEGTLCWTELYTPDVPAATGFYGTVLGWGSYEVPMSGGTYTTVNPAGTDAESMFGGVVPMAYDPRATEAYWLPYFEVADVDLAAARTRELGGKVLGRPADVEDVGRLAQLADPFGARFAVLTSAAETG